MSARCRSRSKSSSRSLLETKSFRLTDGGTKANFVLADDAGRQVDVHAIAFDDDGNGIYKMQDGSNWSFPAAGFSGRGESRGHRVRCLSPEVQVLCHAHGYTPAEKDLCDMELLRARFGVELPVHLQRTSGLFWRAVLAFLALPTVVAGVVPFDRCTGFL